ncbi:MAG: MATE family efflux transporter [Bacteroidaceae bacterium]|nr:MATE family efflux transporter [Bacteroidaceae bacterium]
MTKDELLSRIREGGKLNTSEQLRLTVMLSVPAILAQAASILMFYIDDAMVGSLGALASASIGLVSTTLWLYWSIISCVSMGFSVQVAHLIGANRMDDARDVFRQSIVTAMVIGVLLMAFCALIAAPLPHWLGGGDDIAPQSSAYFLIFILGTPFAMAHMLGSAMLRCAGDMKTPSVASVMMCVLDIAFNFLTIFPTREISLFGLSFTMPGLGLGVAGAALGSIAAEVVISCYVMWYAAVRHKELRLVGESGRFRPERAVLRKATDIAMPVLFQRVLMNAAQITITIIVAPLGAIAIAANVLGITAESLCYMPGYGIGEAATTLVGQSYGAGRPRLTERFAWMTTLLGIGVMTLMGVVMYVAAPLMMATLTPDAAVRALGTECLRIEAWAEPMFAASIVAMSVFIGTGDTRKPAIMNLVSMWFVRVSLAALLAPRYGLQGVWFAMAIELTFRGIIFLVRMRKLRTKAPAATK